MGLGKERGFVLAGGGLRGASPEREGRCEQKMFARR